MQAISWPPQVGNELRIDIRISAAISMDTVSSLVDTNMLHSFVVSWVALYGDKLTLLSGEKV